MEDVMNALQQIDWDQLATLCQDFVAQMDIPGFFTEVANFVKELVAVLSGTAAE